MAILFVIAGHFLFLYTPFRNIKITNINLAIQGCCMSIFYTSVPLFILLTGYLNSQKNYQNISIRNYIGLTKVLLAYIIYSIVSIIFREIYYDENGTAESYIYMIFNYTISPYAWYIEVYICLFLFMPFINILMRTLDSKSRQKLLIGICAFCGFLPMLINRGGVQILPETFSIASSVVAYYCIGLYIALHRPKVNKILLLVSILSFSVIDSLANALMHRSYSPIAGTTWSLYYAIMSTAIFLLLYDVKTKSKILRKVSGYTLDVYLCCWIFDSIYYPYFRTHFYESQMQFFPYILLIVPMVYLSSIMVAHIRKFMSDIMARIYHNIRHHELSLK